MAIRRADRSSLLWPAVLVGIGLAGTLDEVVLHQLWPGTTFDPPRSPSPAPPPPPSPPASR